MAAVTNTIFSQATAERFDKLATIYPMKRSALVGSSSAQARRGKPANGAAASGTTESKRRRLRVIGSSELKTSYNVLI